MINGQALLIGGGDGPALHWRRPSSRQKRAPGDLPEVENHGEVGSVTGMLCFVLRQLDDGMEITAEPGSGSVRLRNPHRPWDDVILDLQCELADTGVHAVTSVRTLDGDGVVTWAASLAESFHGWDGARTWESLEQDLRIDATHDGRGHVSLRFVIRGPRGYEPGAWEASIVVTLDSGEDMRRLVAELTELVSSPPLGP